MLRTNPYFTTATYQQAIQEPFRNVLVILIYELGQMLLALAINTDSYYSAPLPRCCYQGGATTAESGCCVWFVCTSIFARVFMICVFNKRSRFHNALQMVMPVI